MDEKPKRTAKSGRRARNSQLPSDPTELDILGSDTIPETSTKKKTSDRSNAESYSKRPISDKPAKRGGWQEDDAPPVSRSGRRGETSDISSNVMKPNEYADDNADIPVIPELESQPEDLTKVVAEAPNVVVNRMATFLELDNDLTKHVPFASLDNEIDLKLLTKCLNTELDINESDEIWDWGRLFTEVTSNMDENPEGGLCDPDKDIPTAGDTPMIDDM